MRCAKILARICAVAAFAATAFASTSTLHEAPVTPDSPAWTIPLPGYLFRAEQAERMEPRASSSLSLSECKSLGGEVNILFACRSGRVCSREDESGKARGVCLSKF